MIKRRVIFAALAGVLAAIMLPLISTISTPQPQPVNQMYVFGDSLSDTGVAYRLSGGSYPPSPPYYRGRFSNGPVWVEDLAEALQLPSAQVSNFACGGATTSASGAFPPGLLAQVQAFVQTRAAQASPTVEPDALYVLWAGANDYFQGVSSASGPVDNIRSAIAALAQAGAKRILVANLPDLGQLPSTRSGSQSAALNALSEAHNRGLRQSLKVLLQEYPDLALATLDVNALYRQAASNPAQFGLSNVLTACFAGVQGCRQPDQYLFWDDIHPTAAAHRILGQAAYQAVQAVGMVPT